MRSTGLSTPAFALFMFALAVSLHAVHLSSLASPGNSGPKTFYIYWNTSNSVFRIDNTDHIYDINKGNSRFEYDQMNIVCPVYQRGGPTNDDDTEKYIIYNVSKEEYETCRITNPNPRIIAVCDKPYKVMYFTITFRPFTPQPGGLEFLPGHDYYFISTSSREDLHRRVGGRCSTHNMKVLFKVWYPHDAEPSTSTAPPAIASQPSEPGGSWPPPPRSTPDAPALPASTTVPPPPPRPTKKKNKEFGADHPNDVGKRTWSSGGSQVAVSLALVLVAAAVSLR